MLFVLVFASCKQHSAPTSLPDASTSLWQRVVDHMMQIMSASGKFTFTQSLMMKAVAPKMVSTCETDPLSGAQAACLFAVKTPTDMGKLGDCQAFKTNPPKWMGVHEESADLGTHAVEPQVAAPQHVGNKPR